MNLESIIKTGIFHHYVKKTNFIPQDRDDLKSCIVYFFDVQMARFEGEEINVLFAQRLDFNFFFKGS